MAGKQQQKGGGRPGAMTMAMQAVPTPTAGPRVLRIALFKNGRGIEERVLRKRETVSFGSSESNHFIVQGSDIPARFDLFQLVNDDYILNFNDKMTGRVGLPGGVQKLKQLRSSGGARNAGTHWQVKLDANSKGKIQLGDVMVLFQFVPPPPVTPRPQLPAAARGGFVAGIDWLFTAFVVFSYLTFFGLVIYLENADWEIENNLAIAPEVISRLQLQEPPAPPDPVQQDTTEEEETDEGEEVAEEDVPTPSNTNSNSNSNSSGESSNSDSNNLNTNADARARIAQEAAAAAEAMVLGALGSGGALDDVLAGGAPTGNAADILAQATGVGVAEAGSGGTLRATSGGGDGSGQGGMLGQLRGSGNAGMAASEGAATMERRVRGRIRLDGGGDTGGSGDFDARLVQAQIRRRLRAIQRCYERELSRDPSLEGKVTVEFTIVERGTVSGARSVENTTGSPAVASCVVGTVRRFRFNPGPEGGSVSFRYPFVFAPQG